MPARRLRDHDKGTPASASGRTPPVSDAALDDAANQVVAVLLTESVIRAAHKSTADYTAGTGTIIAGDQDACELLGLKP